MKTLYTIIILFALAYVVDAIYPNWEWECSGQQLKTGVWIGPMQPKDLSVENSRAINPDRPYGCTLHPQNFARKVFDWFVY